MTVFTFCMNVSPSKTSVDGIDLASFLLCTILVDNNSDDRFKSKLARMAFKMGVAYNRNINHNLTVCLSVCPSIKLAILTIIFDLGVSGRVWL